MKKLYPVFGIISPLIYIGAVLIGGFLRSDYSHVYNAISELIMTDAPNKLLLDLMFTFYNLGLAILGFGMFYYLESPRTNRMKSASLMLGVIGVLGLVMFFFSQDPRGGAVTLEGIIHIVLAGIMSLLTIIAVFVAGFSFGGEPKLKGLKSYSLLSGVIIVVSGGLTAAFTANGSSYMGVFERLVIGTFIIWVLVLSLKLYALETGNKDNTLRLK